MTAKTPAMKRPKPPAVAKVIDGWARDTVARAVKPRNGNVVVSPESFATINAGMFSAKMFDMLDPQQVFDAIRKETDVVVKQNSMELPQRMLLSQAITLEAVFSQLMVRAGRTTDLQGLQPLLTLAFKAQSGCRVTLEALNEIKNPRTGFVSLRQTNVSGGPQQINNSTPAVAPGNQLVNQATQLLEGTDHGQRMDTAAQGETVASNPHLAPVGAVHRAAH